jgi:L-seryl-tRNA(Ser) seleniumtransferase
MRALRLDKMTLAALQAVLTFANDPGVAAERIPLWRMASQATASLEARASAMVAEWVDVPGLKCEVAPCRSTVGGGSMPGIELPSVGIRLRFEGASPSATARALRQQSIPVVGRVAHDALWLDLRTVDPREDRAVVDAVRGVAAWLIDAGAPPEREIHSSDPDEAFS